MTVYSKNKQVKNNTPVLTGKYLLINLFLMAVTGVLLAGYVFITDRTVSQKYSAKVLEKQLAEVNSALDVKNSEITGKFSVEFLADFAKNRGMVEANEGISVFDDDGVALFNKN